VRVFLEMQPSVRLEIRKSFSTPEYDGFSVDAKVLKLFDGERLESTCNIHVTWTTDSVMGLDMLSPLPCFGLLRWSDRTDDASA
jgi:hypothetical protein